MKILKYLCVDMDVHTQNSGLIVGEGKHGMLTMTEEGEKFEFEETATAKRRRNPRVWTGHRINVSRNLFGDLRVHLRELAINEQLDVTAVAKEIKHELETAKKELL